MEEILTVAGLKIKKRQGDSWAWVPVADTAKLVRSALKARFPGVKFGVRSKSYAGGASITVTWTDGPTASEVEAVAGQYDSGRFDGMIDLAYSVDHWLLPDGSTVIARNPGSQGSGGMNPGEENPAPAGAVRVHFGASSVHCQRDYTAGFLERVQDEFFGPGLRDLGRDLVKASVVPCQRRNAEGKWEDDGTAYYKDEANQRWGNDWLVAALGREAWKTSAFKTAGAAAEAEGVSA